MKCYACAAMFLAVTTLGSVFFVYDCCSDVCNSPVAAEGACCCGTGSKAEMMANCCGETASPGEATEETVTTGAVGTAEPNEDKGAKVSGPLGYTMNGIDGKPVDLKKYQGKVVVIVNVASQCGLTPQYKDLQALHAKYGDQGLAVLGVPANEFGGQEPGTNEQIADFCKKNYAVGFDMLAKVVVKGPGQCDLYKYLTSKDTNPKFAGDIKWNFEKFVIGRNGEVVARFEPRTSPTAPELVKVLEAELAKK